MPRSSAAREVEQARREFRAWDLVLPPVPAELADRLVRRGKLCYSTKPVTISPYCFHEHVERALRPRTRDLLLVAHAGHGINSYALHYYLVRRPVRVLLQLAWGGVYMGREETERANHCFRETRRLVRLAERHGLTVTIVASDFYPDRSCWSGPGMDLTAMAGLRPLELLAHAGRWMKDRRRAAFRRPRSGLDR